MSFILGYYSQISAVFKDDKVYIPNDVYLMSLEFLKQVSEVKLFLNVSKTSNRDLHPLPENVTFVDLGPKASMWRRLFGGGFSITSFVKGVEMVDAMLIQGPTPLLKYAAKYSGSKPKFFLLVGTIIGVQKVNTDPMVG